MKNYAFPFFMLLLLFSAGCTGNAPAQPPASGSQLPVSGSQQTAASIQYLDYSDGRISFRYPDWPSAQPTDAQMFMARAMGACLFSAAKYPVPPSFYKGVLMQYAGSIQEDGEYVSFSKMEGSNQMNAKLRLVYCNYQTYVISTACANAQPDSSFLSSVSCSPSTLNTKPKVGMVATPRNDDPALFMDAIKEARENGVDVLYWYFTWKGLYSNWSISDYVMEALSQEGRTAITFNIIHTSVLGQYPDKYSSFSDPGFRGEFSDFAADFAERYHPDYLFVGNEVDDYLYAHRDKIPAFREILAETREKVHAVSPETKVGFTATYHDAVKNNATDIIVELAPEADLIGYTVYGYHDLFVFDNVSLGRYMLGDVKNVVPGKPYAVVETAWSSSLLLSSSEGRQAEFAEEYFSYLESTDAEFVNWFGLHDGKDCTDDADTFLTDAPWVKEDEEFMVPFREYLCTIGLKSSDGTPKQAWGVWQENT
ncbi:MAG: hypothetical protein AB1657_02065 [Candidatus Micrarchaeota archaeon]